MLLSCIHTLELDMEYIFLGFTIIMFSWVVFSVSSNLSTAKSVGGVCIVGVLFIVILCVCVADSNKEKELVVLSTFEIHSLNVNSQTKGNFILGCGSIHKKEHYIVYIQEDDGAYVRKYFPVDKTKLYLKEGIPRVLTYRLRLIEDGIIYEKGRLIGSERYQIIIPKDSVKMEYNIN